jgi:hypothetical protein
LRELCATDGKKLPIGSARDSKAQPRPFDGIAKITQTFAIVCPASLRV